MDVKHVPNGEPGKTCADCKFYEQDSENSGLGKCFGHDVPATASCSQFTPK